jgi:4-hydroxy-tetrahydrodipicolinate synthase
MNGLMYEEGNPVGLKALLEDMLICTRQVRLPLAPASSGLRKKIIDLQRVKNKG